MASERQKELIGATYRALSETFPGFIARAEQQQMVSSVAHLVTRDGIGMVDAPTGTGKSLGYLIPAIVTAVTEDRVVVVSTATASLQDQLAQKDMPLVLKALAAAGITGVRYAVAKGRERHLCPVKLDNVCQSPDLFQSSEQQSAFNEIQTIWEGGSWSGVRDTIPIKVHPAIWAKVANTSASCVGKKCPVVEECPYYLSVEEAQAARVVIVNHDYLLTIMANVENNFLCDGDKNIYIFDEGHHLSDKILGAFARSLNLHKSMSDELRRIDELVAKRTTAPLGFAVDRLGGMWNAVADATALLMGDSTQHRFCLGDTPAQYLRLLLDLKAALMNMKDVLDTVVKQLNERGSKRGGNLVLLLQSRAGQMKGDLNNAINCLTDFCEDDDNRARWLTRGQGYLEIKCSPFNSAEKARKNVWPIVKRAVITSATLTTLGSFESVRRSLGLPADTPTLSLATPLDYSRARLVVPSLAVDGNDPSHSAMVRAFLMSYAIKSDRMGILVYFTSRKLMTSIYESLDTAEKALVLLQGLWQPTAMVVEHKRRIDAGERSILFGLDSLSEGVDLPGEYCTRVLITRLPFPLPDDPVMATHGEYLTAKGVQPFNVITLPYAGRRLAQIAGRLIRREGDHGDVVVLDGRLCSKKYGGRMIEGTAFKTIDRF